MQKNNIYSSFAVISDVMKLRKPNTLTKLIISNFTLIAKLKWLRLILKVEKYLFNFLRILPLGKFKRGKVLSNQRSHQLLSNGSASTPWNYCWTFEASLCLWIFLRYFCQFLERIFVDFARERGRKGWRPLYFTAAASDTRRKLWKPGHHFIFPFSGLIPNYIRPNLDFNSFFGPCISFDLLMHFSHMHQQYILTDVHLDTYSCHE